ncbi:MAG: bZIP transcription factor [Bdellovibrionota bacterium]
MRSWIFGFVVSALLFGATPLVAEDIYRIEAGKSRDRDLQRRVQRLEQAVDQLQRKVFDLETRPSGTPPGAGSPSGGFAGPPAGTSASTFTTCYIKTPFDGTFSATEPTETAARAGALEKCNAKAKSSIYCEEKDLKCGK